MHAVVVVKLPSPVRLFVTLRTTAFQASLPLPSPRVCLSSCPLMPSNHLLLLCLLLLLPWIFPSIRVFSNESAVCIKWPKYWSFSISPFQVLMHAAAAAAAKSLQACPTLYDHRDCSPPGSPIPGILQARTLEWVAISFSTSLLYFFRFHIYVISYSICLSLTYFTFWTLLVLYSFRLQRIERYESFFSWYEFLVWIHMGESWKCWTMCWTLFNRYIIR